jgi:hypothetical protein
MIQASLVRIRIARLRHGELYCGCRGLATLSSLSIGPSAGVGILDITTADRIIMVEVVRDEREHTPPYPWAATRVLGL